MWNLIVLGWAAGGDVSFAPPERMKAGEAFVQVESPGYACPAWHDVDGDGKKDLVVGQFHGGKLRIHRGLGKGKLGVGTWLQADGKEAQVPGVW